jgi:hypothetical protein
MAHQDANGRHRERGQPNRDRCHDDVTVHQRSVDFSLGRRRADACSSKKDRYEAFQQASTSRGTRLIATL